MSPTHLKLHNSILYGRNKSCSLVNSEQMTIDANSQETIHTGKGLPYGDIYVLTVRSVVLLNYVWTICFCSVTISDHRLDLISSCKLGEQAKLFWKDICLLLCRQQHYRESHTMNKDKTSEYRTHIKATNVQFPIGWLNACNFDFWREDKLLMTAAMVKDSAQI